MLLLKSSVMASLGVWEEAARILELMISTFSEAAGPVVPLEDDTDVQSVLGVQRASSREYSLVRNGLVADACFSPRSIVLEPANFRSKFFPSSELTSFASSASALQATQLIPPAQRYGLTVSAYKESFPDPATRVVTRRLINRELFPESILSTADFFEFLASDAFFFGTRGPLLSTQLWCSLGEIYVALGRLHQAELCAHEAFLHSELDTRIYHLRGLLLERQGRWRAALECHQMGLQIHESVDCRLGCARCYLHMEDQDDGLQLAWHTLLVALERHPECVTVLKTAAEVARRLDLETRAGELYAHALSLEKTDPIVPSAFYIPLVLRTSLLL